MDRYLALMDGLRNRDGIYLTIFAFAVMTLSGLGILAALGHWIRLPTKLRRFFLSLQEWLYFYNLIVFIGFFVLSAKGG